MMVMDSGRTMIPGVDVSRTVTWLSAVRLLMLEHGGLNFCELGEAAIAHGGGQRRGDGGERIDFGHQRLDGWNGAG